MIRFAQPQYLYLLAVIPVIFAAYLGWRYVRRRRLARFGEAALVAGLLPAASRARSIWKVSLLALALAFLSIAAARPQSGARSETVRRRGIDLVIALDISNSMLAEDISPNRITRAKQAIARLTDRLGGDRIGIVVFAGEAFVQLPVTSDYNAARLFLSHIDPGLIQAQGTAIGEALRVATGAFSRESDRSKAIIVISDGENHEGDAGEAVRLADEEGIQVYTLGIGSPEGVPIPVYQNGRQTGFRSDPEGNTVVTRLDEHTLRRIAAAGQGKYILANYTRFGLDELFKEIRKLAETEEEARIFTDYEDHYQWPLAAGLFLLLLEFMLFDRRSRLADRWELFQTRDNA